MKENKRKEWLEKHEKKIKKVLEKIKYKNSITNIEGDTKWIKVDSDFLQARDLFEQIPWDSFEYDTEFGALHKIFQWEWRKYIAKLRPAGNFSAGKITIF